MKIRGRTVELRAIEEEDLPLLHKWGNDPDLWALLGGWHFPTSMAQTKAWFQAQQSDKLNQRFAIDVPGVGLVGTANLVDIDWKNNHAFHGMMLGETAERGKGIGVDTIMSLMRYAFDELHLARLDGSMIEYNEASVRAYCGKCGWKQEGRQRNWYFRQGRYWDRLIVGVTREDYAELVQSTGYWNADAAKS